MWFLVLIVPAFCQPDPVSSALPVLQTTSEGPDAEWISQVAQGIQKYHIARTKSNRGNTLLAVDIDKQISLMRQAIGQRNPNNTVEPETNPKLHGVALEGDMLLSPDQIDELASEPSNGSRAKRCCTTKTSSLWTVGVSIPYQIDNSAYAIRDKILKGIQFWSDNSCLTFVESPSANQRLRYFRGDGCWSYIGKQTGWASQDISIGSGCDSMGTICHETAHAMGFFHTQSRYDRDSYISINFGNIQSAQQSNFQKQTQTTETIFGMPYDYGSVMQYNPYAFAIDYNNPTSVARNPIYQNLMGQRELPAFSDVKSMNLLYNCANRCSSKPNCQNNGIVNSKSCSKCLCPRYFTGNLCDQLTIGNAPTCNGATVQASSTSWTSFTATVGYGMTYKMYDTPVDCYWRIQAPSGRKVSFQVKSLDTECMEQCQWSGFEINTGNLDMAGFLTCCSQISTTVFTSTSNQIVIRGISRFNNANMVFNYRMV